MKKIGILGGTFNPIHNGHLILAETARDYFALDEVWFIPSGCSYMKDPKQILPGEKRAQLVEAAIDDNEAFRLCSIELEREGNTYTCETLSQLHEKYPKYQFYFIVGADILFQMEKWHKPEEIFSKAVIAAAVRDSSSREDLEKQAAYLIKKYHGDIRFLPSLNIELSATIIRKRCQENRSVRYLVPEPVRALLENQGLYR